MIMMMGMRVWDLNLGWGLGCVLGLGLGNLGSGFGYFNFLMCQIKQVLFVDNC